MLLRAFALVSLAALAGCGRGPDELVSSPLGDYRTAYVAEPFLFGAQVDSGAIVRLIERRFPDRSDPDLSNRALAGKLVAVSRCFGLDTAMLVGLVRQESAFERGAVSRTGAAGLTQFTSVAVRESNDQLGERGAAQARAATIEYFNDRLLRCVAPDLGLRQWTQLWVARPGTLKEMRDHLRVSADHALVHGAVLLKTLLSVAKTKAPEADLRALYVEALSRYNGDPDPAVREDYWTRVFRYADDARQAAGSRAWYVAGLTTGSRGELPAEDLAP